MIGAARYWARRFWAARYWPKVGSNTVSVLNLCHGTAASLMPLRTTARLMPIRRASSLMPRRTMTRYCEDA